MLSQVKEEKERGLMEEVPSAENSSPQARSKPRALSSGTPVKILGSACLSLVMVQPPQGWPRKARAVSDLFQ